MTHDTATDGAMESNTEEKRLMVSKGDETRASRARRDSSESIEPQRRPFNGVWFSGYRVVDVLDDYGYSVSESDVIELDRDGNVKVVDSRLTIGPKEADR